MFRSTSLRIGLALITLAIAAYPVLAGSDLHFKSSLRGSNEVPPVDTNAAGVATYVLNAEETAITYRLIVANIDGVTQAHIHCGPFGENGPVVAFLYGFNAAGITTNGILAEGTITQANVIPRAASATCPGGVSNLSDLIEKIRSGGAYTNAHTIAWPGGEIRGQVR